MSFQSVDHLSDSDHDLQNPAAAVPVSGAAAHSQGLRRSGAPKRAFSDIDSLSSEKDLHRKKGRRTKHSAKRASPDVLKERQTSEKNIRATLGKKCSCKRKCLAQFTDIQSFGALVDFRKTFVGMHKLDQDQVVSHLHSYLIAS